MDPRIAKRRRLVAEHGARRRLRTMIVVLVGLGVVGLGYWATQSELLDVDTITTNATGQVDVAAVLSEAGISEGVTLVSAIRTADDVEEALLSDPWVAAASVNVLFPGTIEVEIVERTPTAVVDQGRAGYALVAADTTVLESVAGPVPDLGLLEGSVPLAEGMAFLRVLGDLAAGTTLDIREGEVWAERSGVQARLGRAVDMETKAAAFVALLEEPIPDGWAINLVAPSRPALFEIG